MQNQVEKNLTHVHALLSKGQFIEAMETYLHDDVELREANGDAKVGKNYCIKFEDDVINFENDIVRQVKSAATIQYLLDHLDHRKPYTDSLDYFFAEADFAPNVILTSSAFETLKSIGFELIKKDSLRKEILYLFEVTYPTLMQNTKRIEDQVWPTASVPMYQKHFRREIDRRGHPINYDALLSDKEFTNM